MATRKATRRKHEGVVIIHPDPKRRIGARIRYRDPDSGRVTKEKVPRPLADTVAGRIEFASKKAEVLMARRAEIIRGAGRVKATPLSKAVEEFFEAKPVSDSPQQGAGLRPTTTKTYRAAATAFLDWASGARIKDTSQLNRATLLRYRDHIATRPKLTPKKGGARAERVATDERTAAATLSWHLRAMRGICNFWRKRDMVPASKDDLSDALTPPKLSEGAPEFLRQEPLREVLRIALADDRAGQGRWASAAAFTLFVTLTGMRVSEARTLTWANVRLDEPNLDGKPVGAIEVTAAISKTHKARSISLEPSPAVRELLLAMRAQKTDRDVYVWGGRVELPRSLLNSAHRRLMAAGAPEFSWQTLRATCATFGTNAGGVWGTSSAFASSDRLGHSVTIAQRHYVGKVAVQRTARTLEEAMGIVDLAADIVKHVQGAKL